MPRVKRGTKRTNNRKKVLALAKGFFLAKSKLHRYAQEAVEKSLAYGYKGRKLKKRDFRSLWICRISAGSRMRYRKCRQVQHSPSRCIPAIDPNRLTYALCGRENYVAPSG